MDFCRAQRGLEKSGKHFVVRVTLPEIDELATALEPVLVPQPLKNTVGGIPLLAVPAKVFQQPFVDEAGEAIQLRGAIVEEEFEASPAVQGLAEGLGEFAFPRNAARWTPAHALKASTLERVSMDLSRYGAAPLIT